MIYWSEGLLYLCFAILTGALALRLVPEHARPLVEVPQRLLIGCALAIPLLSYIPLHELAISYADEFELSYSAMLKSLLLDVNAGKAFVWTAIASVGLALLLGMRSLQHDRRTPKLALFIVLLMMIWLGYASHAASISPWKGLIVHTAHFLTATLWLGILFVVSWFSKDTGSHRSWNAFLKWFSPAAVVAVALTLTAGFALMTFTTPQYLNSWMLPYGQLLLVKHLLILPLLLFAYTNGFGYKRILKERPGFNPKPWLRAESAIGLLVLFATAALGQQAPPHIVRETLQTVSPSPLFTAIYRGSFSPDLSLQLSVRTESILMLAAAGIMGAGVILMHKQRKVFSSFIMGLTMPLFLYLGLMFSLQ
ncbi:CopD family protein [Paenibacillus sp. HB172176]|uniref:copper resistance D family protein n=1 Tax=Paenibacillus sp. HB172176 TaxID=2493690 RepID=UPI00143BE507|nr:CopD family protein [Paenibacillus sp. HB172176]